MQTLKINNILGKLYRDYNFDIEEDTAIEWIGEALGFIDAVRLYQQRVCFVEVKNFIADLPSYYRSIKQVAKHNDSSHYKRNINYGSNTPLTANGSLFTNYSNYVTPPSSGSSDTLSDADREKEELKKYLCPGTILVDQVESSEQCPEQVVKKYVTQGCKCPVLDCYGKPISDSDIVYYRPFFDLVYNYHLWSDSSYYRNNYVPVRPSTHNFFGGGLDEHKDSPYEAVDYEYRILHNNKLKFNFVEGSVAISYLGAALDETGMPLIPYHITYRDAITKYLVFKYQDKQYYSHLQGSADRRHHAKKDWEDALVEAQVLAIMPQGIDEWEAFTQVNNNIMPQTDHYDSFFGNLGKPEIRSWNNPDNNHHNNYNRNGRYSS